MNSHYVERVETGILGLDELLDGGIQRGNSVLISGGAGTGKTTFGIQFLVDGIDRYEPGVFIQLEKYIHDLKKNMLHFGWDLAYLEEENKLRLMRLDMSEFGSLSEGEINIDQFFNRIRSAVEEIKAQRIVIDPISIMGSMYQSDFKFRSDLGELQHLLRGLNCTTLMTSDLVDEHMSGFNVEEFVAHGVILLHYIKKDYMRLRGLEVRKMQGTDHSQDVHSMEITSTGLRVYSGAPVQL